jgi:cell division transport system permease protein
MSFFTTAKRIVRYGFVGFVRNGFVSLAAILIMVVTLFVVSGLLISRAALSQTLTDLSQKVDVNVYFVTTAPEDQILSLKQQIEALPEVANVAYVSRDQALADFKERHKDDQLEIQALDELKSNPLGASLAIRAKQTSQYESISKFLSASPAMVGSGSDQEIIEKVNFLKNKTAIDRLSDLIATSKTLGLGVTIIFGFISVLIAFNTIRLAIYISRDEISVMNLVGAGHWYVRGPFVISGILYGVIAGVIVLVSLYPITLYLGPASARLFVSFNTYTFYIQNFPTLFLVIMGTGIALGALSSYLAVHRYLNQY